MHPAQLFFDDLGNLGLGRQDDFPAIEITGLQYKVLRRDLLETECFHAVRKKIRFGIRSKTALNVGNQFTLAIFHGKELGTRLAVHHQGPGGEGRGVAETQDFVTALGAGDRNRFLRRNRQDRDVLHPLPDHRANDLRKLAASGWNFIPSDASHRLFRLDPRSARLAPARRVEHHQLHLHPRRFLEGMPGQRGPFRRHHLDRAAALDIADHGALDADLGHGFQILGDAIRRDVAVQPIPVTPRLGRLGRILKSRERSAA